MEIRRARPLLGTIVEVRVSDVDEPEALRAIDEAFREIAIIQQLMSFHERDSDLSRLNREAAYAATRVDSRTHEVLRLALALAEESDGCFDPTVAAELVQWGLLPSPVERARPEQEARWRDVHLLENNEVRFTRPLWLDFGGIAKGYAVDRAIERLLEMGVSEAAVNAGGDLRLIGSRLEIIHLRSPESPTDIVPAFEIRNASVASSSGYAERQRHEGRWVGPHVDGRNRSPIDPSKAVTVVTQRCVIADALTKVVLTDEERAKSLLGHYEATAFVHDPHRGWRTIGES